MTTNNAVDSPLSGTTGTGNFVGSNAPTLIAPILGAAQATSLEFSTNDGLLDSNGNTILALSAQASAVNYITASNASTTNAPVLYVQGSDTNIGCYRNTKGTGQHIFQSANTTVPFIINSGTTYQHTTNFAMANTSSSRTVTFPDATGTLQLQSQPLITAPVASASSSLTVGSAYQNTLGYDVMLVVYLAVASATTASVALGVGTTNSPTQQTIISSLTTAALLVIPVPIYIPNNYYALLSVSGTISQSISGQMAMAI